MTRLRQVLAFGGLLVVAVVLVGALWYDSGSPTGGGGEGWTVAEGTVIETVGVSRGEGDNGTGRKKQPQVSGKRKLTVLNETDEHSEDDQASGQVHKARLQASSEDDTVETAVYSDVHDSHSPEVGDVLHQTASALNFTVSLSRLSSTLNFDYSTCPKDSLVHTASSTATFEPKHKDCPSLFIIGARKGGTTSLIQYLSKHPHFVGARLNSKEKAGETMYYTLLYNRHNWKDYMKFFPPPTPGVLTGESSVAYATRCPVPRRIVDDCGTNPKIVYLIRNPYRRFESNYFMRLRLHPNYPNINEIFRKEWSNLVKALNGSVSDDGVLREGVSLYEDFKCSWESNSPNMLYDSLYFVFLSHWLCNYPAPENIMIVNSEEFFENPGRILNQIFTFLGLSELSEANLSSIVSSVYNKGKYHDAGMSAENRKLLQSLYDPFIRKILALLKWNVDWSL